MGNYPFLRVFFLCFSPPENLACNTKTRLSRVKSFFCVQKKQIVENGEVLKQEKKSGIHGEKSTISKEILIIKVRFFLVFGCLEWER